MRLPVNVNLVSYIHELIDTDKLYKFYKSANWIELKNDVLYELHNECQECLKRGKYTRAECVHHVNEVRVRPDLALSKYYKDKDGIEQRNLLPLCNACHNQVHDKFDKWNKEQGKEKFTNEERW